MAEFDETNTGGSGDGGENNSGGSAESNTAGSVENQGNTNSGSGDPGNTGDGNGGNAGFDGEFEPERARALIDRLRDENRAKDKAIADNEKRLAELEKLASLGNGANGDDGKDTGDGKGDNESEALKEIRQLRAEMAEEKRKAEFTQFATSQGLRPEAAGMAWREVQKQIEPDLTNLSMVVESLKSANGFMFAETTGGQGGKGGTGAGGSTGGTGKVPTADEATIAKNFNMTIEEYRSFANSGGQRPVKPE